MPAAAETPAQSITVAEAPVVHVVEKPLIYVTGKGACGKTTVAAALGLAAAATGRRAIVCELAQAHHLPDAFGARRRGAGKSRRLAERLWWLSIDPREALVEWMRRQPGGALAAGALGHSRGFAHFVDAAPGGAPLAGGP